MRRIFNFVFGILILTVIGGLGYLILTGKAEILNPLSSKKTVINQKKDVKIVGFLPTWMVGKTVEYTDEIDNLIFLGIEVDENGNLIWDTQSKKINSEIYLKQKDLIWKNGGKNILGIKLFDDEKLDKFMSSEEAQINLISQLVELKKTNKFDGVNVDFEYQGNPTAVLSEEIINFLTKLRKENLGEISMDVFVNTIIKGSVDQISSLINAVDELIIMAYDFHRPGVDYTGAVAPIGAPVGERNILELIEKIGSLALDKNKIVLAFPLYGYEWKTYGSEFGAQVKRGWYQMISWKNSEFLISNDKNIKVNWDEISMTPWINYEENGENHQIYFENLKSLTRKLELVKNNQFGGVGFWALGYEGEDRNIWNLISNF